MQCGKGLFQRLSIINKTIKRFSPDVVISFLDSPNILASLLKMGHRKWKLIVSERNTTQQLNFREYLKFFLYRYADIIVPNSYSQEDFIKKYHPCLANKCQVITNFVETDLFCPSEIKKTNNMTRIIGVGRIANQKNIPILIEAVKLICDKGENVRVDWYGNSFEAYDDCMCLINQYGLQAFFEFHKPYNPIVEKYNESDIFVLPSLYEGFPNVLCEAMSCGLISIASDVCDNGRIIDNGITGFLFPSGDSQKLAKCIMKVISMTTEQRVVMRNACRKFAIDKFSEEEFINKYITLIEQ